MPRGKGPENKSKANMEESYRIIMRDLPAKYQDPT